ncbi:hypothetical protein P691DRAFT_772687 [Macrolepiota fuliginosa MF-IS2]|uniref:Uncharacterized protein n=1 Tax=Macrolepiota fuliginosa MF-IS2 TaxID=1400762 RepID=A0A9P5XK97_9AGAR|nr:hypothetical protein P691DRAFT_772687 [Macrolepiota fuliginosa MF-IS2]
MSQSPNVTKDRAPKESTDSSSSRESSPEPATLRKPRSFSPESESSESVAPQITVVHDSTSPPDQPVIRQGLAFRTVATRNINTYEPAVKTGDVTFLPGQAVQTTVGAPTSIPGPVTSRPPVSSASPTPGPPASSSNPATPSPHLSAMSTPSDKSAAQRGTKKVVKPATKKAKHGDDTSFVTGRFRLSQYSAASNDSTPLHHGHGPYASVYRAPVPSVEVTPPGTRLEASSPAAPPTSVPNPGTRIIMADPSPKAIRRSSKPQAIPPTAVPVQDDSTDASPTQSRAHSGYTIHLPASPQPTQCITIASPTNRIPRVSAPSPTPSAVSPAPGSAHPSANHPQPTGYYRRNYEHDSQPSSRADPSQPPPTSIRMNESHSGDATMAPPPAELAIYQLKGKEREVSGQRQHQPELSRPPKGTVRLVTALIEDNRTNPPDHLLAEVYIRCWSGSRPDELWCDAKDLSEALQASASRIDGPAKVFTQRGAYRQCFLRITAEQEDRYNSMNLALASDRTIPISVEYWAPPGAQPKSANSVDWRMPWHTSPTPPQAHLPPQSQYHPYPQSHSHPQYPPASQHHAQPHIQSQPQPHHPYYAQQSHDDGRHLAEPSRKRQAFNDGAADYSPESPLRRAPYGAPTGGQVVHDPRHETLSVSRNPSSAYPRKRHVPDASSPTDDNMPGEGAMDTRPDYKNAGYESSQSEDVRQVVSDMIDDLMRIDVTVNNYNRLLRTHKLMNIIHAYRMVEEIYNKYVGRPLPVKGTNVSHTITEVDIAKGLGAEDPRRFVSECRETLWLLDLYGERGQRGENPKVLEMLKDTRHSDLSPGSIKQLRKLLKDIDAQWMREHAEGSGGGEAQRSTPRLT